MEKRLYVWGSGGTGQLGLGTEDDSAIPQLWTNAQVQLELETVTSGGCHSAGVSKDNQLFLWGSDERSQLGRTELDQEQDFLNAPNHPVARIPVKSKTKLVACGWWHTLVVVSPGSDNCQDDRVFSWGSNDHHQLGRSQRADDGEAGKSEQIIELPPRLRVANIACGWKHSLLATAEGDVFAWGSGRHGQLGLSDDILVSDFPKRIHGLVAIANVFCGWEHSVFRSSSGEVFTCGNNRHGQLGLEISTLKVLEHSIERRKKINSIPTRVSDPRDSNCSLRAAQVGCGWHFVLCLTESGELVTWGKGSHGQLGLGGFENASEPQIVAFPHPLQQIACGSEHSMVVTSSRELYTCGWGEHGNLGHGDKTDRATLEKVDFFATEDQAVISVAAGGAVSLAVTRSRHC